MLPHVRQLAATMRAIRAHGRFLTCMRTHVLTKVGTVVEPPITQFAFQWLNSLVLDGMETQVIAAKECLATRLASVGLGPIVKIHVSD